VATRFGAGERARHYADSSGTHRTEKENGWTELQREFHHGRDVGQSARLNEMIASWMLILARSIC
jgi:hypothetical protein